MNVLVTGATGFLGSEVAHQLLNDGHHVRIFRRETSSLHLLRTIENEIEHSIGDITDLDSLRDAMKGIQVVFHVAGNVQVGSKTLNLVNAQGTAAVVDAAKEGGIERLVHTSSIVTIGTSSEGPSDEFCELQNKSGMWPYGKSKYMAELEVHRGIAEGLDAVIVNPGVIVGPDRSAGNALNICHEFALKIRAGKIWLYPGGGTHVGDTADIAAGHLAALEHGKTGSRYILGSENLTWKSILSTLAEAFGVNPPRIPLPYHLTLWGGILADCWSSISGKNLDFGRSSVKHLFSHRSYSNQRAVNELDCSFRPFTETAKRVADSLPG